MPRTNATSVVVGAVAPLNAVPIYAATDTSPPHTRGPLPEVNLRPTSRGGAFPTPLPDLLPPPAGSVSDTRSAGAEAAFPALPPSHAAAARTSTLGGGMHLLPALSTPSPPLRSLVPRSVVAAVSPVDEVFSTANGTPGAPCSDGRGSATQQPWHRSRRVLRESTTDPAAGTAIIGSGLASSGSFGASQDVMRPPPPRRVSVSGVIPSRPPPLSPDTTKRRSSEFDPKAVASVLSAGGGSLDVMQSGSEFPRVAWRAPLQPAGIIGGGGGGPAMPARIASETALPAVPGGGSGAGRERPPDPSKCKVM